MLDKYLTSFRNTYGNFRSDLNFSSYEYIPTVKYRNEIALLFKNSLSINDIYLICPAIMLPNGMIFYTSNDPLLAVAYMTSGLYRADNYFLKAYNTRASYFFPRDHIDNDDLLQKSVSEILITEFNLHNSYCIIRRCDDCTVIVGIAHNYAVKDVLKLYQATVGEIELFVLAYFDKLLGLYVENLPTLKHSRFVKDKKFREEVIKNRNHKVFECSILTSREIECLYWSSRGKTTYEISIIMKISEYTVNEYKKLIMQKLNVSNMVHAVREGIKLNLIS